jgi:tryptophan 2-monooxygenase
MSFFTTSKSGTHDSNYIPPCTYVDVLYDHAGYLRTNRGRLGSGNLAGKTVGIVGAGAAGLSAGYLLAAMGASVTIFEAGGPESVGGRIRSLHPIQGDAAIFEMGAMRVPPSEQLFSYFAELFGVKPGGQFPDPGKVHTKIIFENQTYDWPAGAPAPDKFKTVSTAWGNLANSFAGITALLGSPKTMFEARPAWQKLIYNAVPPGPEEGYSTISFYQGLVQAFVENYQKYGLAEPWGPAEFALFGALGVGSGGFGPLYQVNFAEIIRLIVNGLETDQQFYPGGLDKLIAGFRQLVGPSIKFNAKVTRVDQQSSASPVVFYSAPGSPTPFNAVIIATTTRSMQVDMGLTDPPLPPLTLDADQNTAIRELHLMNSSKLFVLTKSKFWTRGTGPSLPANIQTDGLVRGLYCLDYGPTTNYGVVLISYTWGDDSTKYIAVKSPQERLAILLNSLRAGVPDFVAALEPEILPEYTRLVDWQEERGFYGAFKLNYPGQDPLNQSLYFQFLKTTKDIFLAGDSVGWCGGWIEGALQTGVNAAAAVVNRLGGNLYPGNPLEQKPNLYQYGP